MKSCKLNWIRILAIAVCLYTVPGVANTQKVHKIILFGVALKGADRAILRQTFTKNGMKLSRKGSTEWVDNYDAPGILEGATEFKAGYVLATGKFAFAEYTFPITKASQTIKDIISMVSMKYGSPMSQTGSYEFGPVNALWKVAQGMEIEVSRAWPDNNVFLKFLDPPAYKQMQAEIEVKHGG